MSTLHVSQEEVNDLSTTKRQVLYRHADEISARSRLPPPTNCAPHIALKKDDRRLLAALHFVMHGIFNYFITLLTLPQALWADLPGTIFSLLVLPPLHIGLFAVQVIFLIGRLIRLDLVGDWFSDQYGHGLTLVNMVDPGLLNDNTTTRIHEEARKGLTNSFGYPDESPPDHNDELAPPRYFNLDIAKSLIILCALVYERDDKSVEFASDAAKRNDLSEEDRRQQVARYLLQSTKRITSHAARWNLNFSSISDLVSTGGPFCGLFWPKTPGENWIVLAFKGTSPTNFSEFMIDATIAHQNACSFFGHGAVHQGFYTSLVPGEHSEINPYAGILHSLKQVARSMRKDRDAPKINLWITGHSLGAALSGLVYARLLFTPKDLGDDLALRQGYMYGMPRVADSEFISAFNFTASTPFGDTSQSMWRIVDCSDIVTTVPKGLADVEESRVMLPQTSLLNYGHFGTAGLKLTGCPKGPGWEIQPGSFRGGSTMKIVQCKPSDIGIPAQALPAPNTIDVLCFFRIDPIAVLRWAFSLVAPMYDHFPTNYYARLQQVKPDVMI